MSSKLPAVSLHPFSVIIISGLLNLSLSQPKRFRKPKGVIFNQGDPDLFIFQSNPFFPPILSSIKIICNNLPVPRRIIIRIKILIGFVTDVVDIAGLIDRQRTGVVIDAEEIRTALNQQLLLGGEFRQPRLIESLLSAFLPNLVQNNTPKLNTSWVVPIIS